jgi:hypothetical protein
MDSLEHQVLYIPPLPGSQPRPPIILRNKSNHFTVLQPCDPTTSEDVLQAFLPILQAATVNRYIGDSSQCRIAGLLGACAQAGEAADLRAAHSILHRDLSDTFARTPSQTMANAQPHAALQLLGAVHQDETDAGHDLLADAADEPRPISPSPQASPTKAPLVSLTPPRGLSSGRTPRDCFSSPDASQSAPSVASSPASVSSLSNVSEKDLGQLVETTCGRSDNHYASRIGVRGAVTPDETSDSGSFRSSGLASGSTSQAPSIYSTGSFHPHPIPNGTFQPPCASHHSMQFGRFTQPNHRCDNPTCALDITQGSFGWHCEVCSFDYCRACFPCDWQPIPSQSTLDDSMSTMQLNSASSSPVAAPRLQESADAAAVSRGHDD